MIRYTKNFKREQKILYRYLLRKISLMICYNIELKIYALKWLDIAYVNKNTSLRIIND